MPGSSLVTLVRRVSDVTTLLGYLNIFLSARTSPFKTSVDHVKFTTGVIFLVACAARYYTLWVPGSSLFKGAFTTVVSMTSAMQRHLAGDPSNPTASPPGKMSAFVPFFAAMLNEKKKLRDAVVGLALCGRFLAFVFKHILDAIFGARAAAPAGAAGLSMAEAVPLICFAGLCVAHVIAPGGFMDKGASTLIARTAEPLYLLAIAFEVTYWRVGAGAAAPAAKEDESKAKKKKKKGDKQEEKVEAEQNSTPKTAFSILVHLVAVALSVGASILKEGWVTKASSLQASLKLVTTSRAAGLAVLKILLVFGSSVRFQAMGFNWYFVVLTVALVGTTVALPANEDAVSVLVGPYTQTTQAFIGYIQLLLVMFIGFGGGGPGVLALAILGNAMIHVHGLDKLMALNAAKNAANVAP